jgi:hypothetical protein
MYKELQAPFVVEKFLRMFDVRGSLTGGLFTDGRCLVDKLSNSPLTMLKYKS